MFLATGFLFALTRALLAPPGDRRVLWGAAALVLLPVIATTGSRTGWVVSVVGIILLLIAAPLQLTRTRLAAVIAAGIVGLTTLTALVPSDVPSPTGLVGGSSGEVRESSRYRERTAGVRALGRQPPPVGRAPEPGGVGARLEQHVDRQRVPADRERVRAHPARRLPPHHRHARRRARAPAEDRVGLALPAITLANFAGLFFVAMITQQEIYIWALVGSCAGLVAAARSGEHGMS